MSVAVPSRFACLKIEDDDNNNRSINQTNRKKLTNNNNNTSKTTMAKKVNTNKKTNQKQSNDNRQPNTNLKKQKKKQNDKQWEEWKKRDNELLNDNFEQDLQYALIQSKLQYEVDIKNKVTNETTTTTETDKHNKKKKNKPMNLAEFLETDTDNQIDQNLPINTMINGDNQQDNHEDFFDKMMEVAKREVIKGKLEEERKERDINFEEMITRTQFEEKLKFEQQRNVELQKQLDEARAEIVAVKERNKIFCTILAQGEMKDKAGILLELERLNNVKDELTEEVARLHELLEQERSKSTSLLDSHNTTTKHKDNNKNKK